MGITYSSLVRASPAETFAWHERRGALQRLSPPWQHLRVVQEADTLSGGQAVLRLPGGVMWVAAHDGYRPPNSFSDHLVSLPLPWRHTHRFEAAGEDVTRVTDVVRTPVPARALRPMFAYRHRQLADDLATQQQMATLAPRPLTVAMTGSSGLVGTALASLLTTGGHRVVRLVRGQPKGPDERRWDPAHPEPALLDGTDAVVHLAGASIAGRFNQAHKSTVRDSRVGPTEKLARCLYRAQDGPSVFVAASAVGFYGPDRGDELLDESSPKGHGFLAELVADWEQAAGAAEDAGARVVCVRTGLVQSARGGMLALMRPLFQSGLGGRLGSGDQWASWVDLDDLTDIYYRALVDQTVSGPVVATAPVPVTNREYSATLARVLCRPALLPVPPLGPKLLLGDEGAQEVALAGQRARPTALLRAGHRFRWPSLEGCLRHQLGRAPSAYF
jgi:uncharacterized protein